MFLFGLEEDLCIRFHRRPAVGRSSVWTTLIYWVDGRRLLRRSRRLKEWGGWICSERFVLRGEIKLWACKTSCACGFHKCTLSLKHIPKENAQPSTTFSTEETVVVCGNTLRMLCISVAVGNLTQSASSSLRNTRLFGSVFSSLRSPHSYRYIKPCI